MKQPVDVFSYAGHICAAMKPGILLTTAASGEVNTMTIGWGKIGVEWGLPVFIAYVRESRHTKQMLEQCGEFTVNIPYGELDGKILGFCGTKSGRDLDKISELGLHLEQSDVISVPGIKELPLTLECKVLYKQQQYQEKDGQGIHLPAVHFVIHNDIICHNNGTADETYPEQGYECQYG